MATQDVSRLAATLTLILTLIAALAAGACSPGGDTPGSGGSGGAAGSGGITGTGGAGGSGGSGSGGNLPGSGGSSPTGTGGAGTGGTPTGGSGGSLPTDAAADVAIDTGPPPECNYPQWKAGVHYNAGDIVMYMGKPYIATNANDGLDPTISTFFWAVYMGCTPPPPPPAIPCPVLDRLAPAGQTTFQATYDAMFAAPFQGRVIHAAYTYEGLCQALNTPILAPFVRSNNLLQDRREITAFFANVAVETAYLAFVDEGGAAPTLANFHGRGALQITGQAIYQEAGAALGLNLVGNQPLASTAPVVWQTGIWYWTLHANPSVGLNCHQAIAAGNFGRTIRIIKGDCASAPDRVRQYQKNATLLGIDPGILACP